MNSGSEEIEQGSSKRQPKTTMDSVVNELVRETSKIILVPDVVGKGHVEPDPRASKAAPPYIQQLFGHPELPGEDESYSTPFDSSNSRSLTELENFKRKLQDDDRLASMYKLRHCFSTRYDNRAWLHPHGTTNFDYRAIPKLREAGLEELKNKVRKENYVYLGKHPEIQGMISLFLKKLLTVQPHNAADYLAEFFSTRLKDFEDFEEQLKDEMKKISRYHVSKMRATGKVNFRPTTTLISEAAGTEWSPEMDVNYFKRLNIGPLAADFSSDPSCLLTKKKDEGKEKVQLKTKTSKKKRKSRKYCGCKDWKLKKEKVRVTPEMDSDQVTFSTVGYINTLLISEEEEWTEEEDEKEKEEKGEFEGLLGKVENRELTQEEAERVASELVREFIGSDDAVYGGHHHSMGNVKNIQ